MSKYDLRRFPSCAPNVMKFHLVYHGSLPASGNKSKSEDVVRIRKELSPQLELLWKTHPALKRLKDVGAQKMSSAIMMFDGDQPTPRQLATAYPDDYKDVSGPLWFDNRWYYPLVRESLHLSCELEVLFLRQQEPGALISQGGDIDNRIKTLLDALRMPDADEQRRARCGGAIYCLMQSDTLVSRLDVNTDRLLIPSTDNAHEVHLVIEVTLNVLEVTEYNMCLL